MMIYWAYKRIIWIENQQNLEILVKCIKHIKVSIKKKNKFRISYWIKSEGFGSFVIRSFEVT